MDDFQAKSRWRRMFYSRPVLVFLAIIVLLLLRPVWKIWVKSRMVEKEHDQVTAQLEELQSRRAFLEREIAALQTERGMEGEIRKKFPVVKEGEKVIIVGDEEATSASTTATSTSWWKSFKDLF